tara:strand:- start:866 stop:1063 length:198 start_codon:yes stop_codon:yes gene_type:complete
MAYYSLQPIIPSHNNNNKPILHYITTDEEELGRAFYRVQLMYDVDEVKVVEITEQQWENRRRVKS